MVTAVYIPTNWLMFCGGNVWRRGGTLAVAVKEGHMKKTCLEQGKQKNATLHFRVQIDQLPKANYHLAEVARLQQ